MFADVASWETVIIGLVEAVFLALDGVRCCNILDKAERRGFLGYVFLEDAFSCLSLYTMPFGTRVLKHNPESQK